jgi:hypothetical protein
MYGLHREKDGEFRKQYEVSFLQRAEFETKTLKEFKNNVKSLNTLRKPPVVKTNEQKKAERTKHEQNRKMCEKKGFPKFDMIEANTLLEGQYHEDDEDDIEETEKLLRNRKEIHF